MFIRVDHIGYVVRDLSEGIAALCEPYGLRVAMELELPEFALRAAFLTGGEAMLEAIEFTDPDIARARLGEETLRLDHVGYEVTDIHAAAKSLRDSGARFCTPNGRPLKTPLELGGALHLWTTPAGAPSVCLQLIQRSGGQVA